MKACVVIGANYGDEGKGLVTDFLTSLTGAELVVRFNGGAQAGHTVVTPCGRRHVFHHFGAGTLAGAATYLSHHFIVNPLLFNKEHEELLTDYRMPVVHVNPEAPVTTIYDMLINQLAEEVRGASRHGSCGIGINETVHRHETSDYKLCVGDLFVRDENERTTIQRMVHMIATQWVPLRLVQLGITPTSYFSSMVDSLGVMNKWIQEALDFTDKVNLAGEEVILSAKGVIFEGAQGLLLDQNNRDDFPHVTRSNTGLKNVVEIAERVGIFKQLDVHYVTRPYLTRHGAGRLHKEWPTPPFKVDDQTNVHNQYQGAMRYAPISPISVASRVHGDVAQAEQQSDLEIRPYLAMTCSDHMPFDPEFFDVKIPRSLMSTGPARNQVRW